jgi:hypothetical protein
LLWSAISVGGYPPESPRTAAVEIRSANAEIGAMRNAAIKKSSVAAILP